MASWYAIRCTSRQETFVAKALGEAGLTGYVPLHITEAKFARRVAVRARALIPGYVFAELADDEAVQAALSIHGVIRSAALIKIKPLEIAALALAEAWHKFDETWVPPKVKGKRYSYRWRAGDRVRIINGPAAGHAGVVICAKGKDRMEVLLTLFGRPWEVVTEHRNLELAQDVACPLAA